MALGRRLPLPALLLALACAALAQRPLTEKQRACLLPPDEGPCRALVPRWYYDRHTQSCQQFTYGGCYGNANNFLTFDDCEKSCWTIKTGPLLCYSPKDEGLCSSSVPRYYYDTKTKSCKEFRYTGCGGNANNFVTEMDCYNVCRNVQMDEDTVADNSRSIFGWDAKLDLGFKGRSKSESSSTLVFDFRDGYLLTHHNMP
ncbi:Tissue factor pathway inhibitor 2 [Turdus rufiventris]|nr:Tissue factor pathway inhibitor 2 [Turdus rufiventris]